MSIEKFSCFFFLQNWVGVDIGETGWNILRWLTVVRDVFPPHLSQRRPENTHTAFKHQETGKHYHLVLSNKVQNYLLLFNCHILIRRDICRILKAFNCFLVFFFIFLHSKFQQILQFSECLKIFYLRKVKSQNLW